MDNFASSDDLEFQVRSNLPLDEFRSRKDVLAHATLLIEDDDIVNFIMDHEQELFGVDYSAQVDKKEWFGQYTLALHEIKYYAGQVYQQSRKNSDVLGYRDIYDKLDTAIKMLTEGGLVSGAFSPGDTSIFSQKIEEMHAIKNYLPAIIGVRQYIYQREFDINQYKDMNSQIVDILNDAKRGGGQAPLQLKNNIFFGKAKGISSADFPDPSLN